MLLQHWELLDVVPRIAALKRRAFADGITLMPCNNVGCYGPEQTLLRSPLKGQQGLRERLVLNDRAPGLPFDNGRFDLVVEPLDAPDPRPARREGLLKIWPGSSDSARP
jgi:hypothetical protein